MGRRVRGPALVGLTMVLAAAAGCAGVGGGRIENGVYRSPKGYHITLPGEGWAVTADARADLALAHQGEAAMLVNADCNGAAVRRPPAVLVLHLLAGLRDRSVIERDETSIGGHRALHRVVEGTPADGAAPVKVEAYVVTAPRCVYDLLYAAPPASFADHRPDFARFVASFTPEPAPESAAR